MTPEIISIINRLHYNQIVDLFRLPVVQQSEAFRVYKNKGLDFIFYSDSDRKDICCIDVSTLAIIDKYNLFIILSQSISQLYFISRFALIKQIQEFSFSESISFNQVMKVFFNLTSLDKIPESSFIPSVFKSLSAKDAFRGRIFYNPMDDSFSIPLFSEGKITDFVDFNFSFFRSRNGYNRGFCEIAPLIADFPGERCLVVPSNPVALLSFFYCTGFEEGQSGVIISPVADEVSLNALFSYYVKNKYSKILFVYDNAADFLPDNLIFILKIICHFITLQTKYVPSVSVCNGLVHIIFLRFAETFQMNSTANLCSKMNESVRKNIRDDFSSPVDFKGIGSGLSFDFSHVSYTKTEKKTDSGNSAGPVTKSSELKISYPIITFPNKSEFLDVCIKQFIDYFMLKNFSLQGIHSKNLLSEESPVF